MKNKVMDKTFNVLNWIGMTLSPIIRTLIIAGTAIRVAIMGAIVVVIAIIVAICVAMYTMYDTVIRALKRHNKLPSEQELYSIENVRAYNEWLFKNHFNELTMFRGGASEGYVSVAPYMYMKADMYQSLKEKYYRLAKRENQC